jgi:hypothetical protein
MTQELDVVLRRKGSIHEIFHRENWEGMRIREKL